MTTQNRLYLLVGGPPVVSVESVDSRVRPIKLEEISWKDVRRWMYSHASRLVIRWTTPEEETALLHTLERASQQELMPETAAKLPKLEDDQTVETLYAWYELDVLHYKLVTIGLPGAPEFKSAAVQALAKEQRVIPPMPFAPQLPPRPDDNKPDEDD